MAKKAPTKYVVIIGCNVPDPSGKRDDRGRPVEMRFEPGEEITESSVPPAALTNLLSTGAVRAEVPSAEATGADQGN